MQAFDEDDYVVISSQCRLDEGHMRGRDAVTHWTAFGMESVVYSQHRVLTAWGTLSGWHESEGGSGEAQSSQGREERGCWEAGGVLFKGTAGQYQGRG